MDVFKIPTDFQMDFWLSDVHTYNLALLKRGVLKFRLGLGLHRYSRRIQVEVSAT